MNPRWTPESITRAQARFSWQQELRSNGFHLKDAPGVHLDNGVWVDQLRYHDSGGVLRGVLRLHHEPTKKDEPKHDWDDWSEKSGFLWICADPSCLRQGIAMSLLDDAVRRGWPLDFEKQEYTPAGRELIRAYLRRLKQAKKGARIDGLRT